MEEGINAGAKLEELIADFLAKKAEKTFISTKLT
jgi:hypothetical protein